MFYTTWDHFLGAFELIVLCAYWCKVRYFDTQIRVILWYKKRNLAFWETITTYSHGIKLQNNLHSSSFPLTPSLKKYCTNLKPLFLAFSDHFYCFRFFYHMWGQTTRAHKKNIFLNHSLWTLELQIFGIRSFPPCTIWARGLRKVMFYMPQGSQDLDLWWLEGQPHLLSWHQGFSWFLKPQCALKFIDRVKGF